MTNRKENAYQKLVRNESSGDEEDDAVYSTPRRNNNASRRNGSEGSDTGSQLLELTAKRSLSSVSVTLANLPLDERNFLVLVEDGHVPAVEKFLEVGHVVSLYLQKNILIVPSDSENRSD